MTLAQWKEKYGILSTHPTTETGAVSVCVNFDCEERRELFHLDDYKVSSVNGVVIWLVPVPSGYYHCTK
jgi:hypothetical protein